METSYNLHTIDHLRKEIYLPFPSCPDKTGVRYGPQREGRETYLLWNDKIEMASWGTIALCAVLFAPTVSAVVLSLVLRAGTAVIVWGGERALGAAAQTETPKPPLNNL